MRESDIQNTICEYLTMKGYFFFRVNTIPVYDTKTKVFRRMPKYAKAGVSDLILILNGQFVGLEIKQEHGIQSEHQKLFQQGVERNGGKYLLIRSLNDLIQQGL